MDSLAVLLSWSRSDYVVEFMVLCEVILVESDVVVLGRCIKGLRY